MILLARISHPLLASASMKNLFVLDDFSTRECRAWEAESGPDCVTSIAALLQLITSFVALGGDEGRETFSGLLWW